MYQLPKILSANLIQQADEYTIKNEPIASIDLMERASKAFVEELITHVSVKDKIAVFCGVGNNGGDGFAIARLLIEKEFNVSAYFVPVSISLSTDCEINKNRLKNVITVQEEATNVNLGDTNIIIDAIFGSGLSRPIEGVAAHVVDKINSAGKQVFSVDVPSGIYCDTINESNIIVKSDVTITFQRPKQSFFFPETRKFLKAFKVVNIGLDESFIQSSSAKTFILNKTIAKSVIKRKKFCHKGTFGHATLYAGSFGKMGAATLSAKACLKSGAGLLTARIPKCGYTIMQLALPEAMCSIDDGETHLISPYFNEQTTVGIGPGIGLHKQTKKMVEQLLDKVTTPMVIDADALNIIAENKPLLKKVPQQSILTPHPKEFERLVGPFKNAQERLEKQIAFSNQYNIILVVKDAYTFITDSKGNVFINTTGNPGMAKGGSGDVLTGIILGLLTQGYDSLLATLIGVYFHGFAGDKAKDKKGELAMLPTDLLDELNIGTTII